MSAFARLQSASRQSTRHRLYRGCACCEIAEVPANPARRNFLAGGITALGLGGLGLDGLALGGLGLNAATSRPAAAQPAAPKLRIDVHHHYLPPVHAAAMTKNRVGAPPPAWSPQLSLADMEKAGATTAVLSLMQPGVWFGDA
jgi:hypothetical protein